MATHARRLGIGIALIVTLLSLPSLVVRVYRRARD